MISKKRNKVMQVRLTKEEKDMIEKMKNNFNSVAERNNPDWRFSGSDVIRMCFEMISSSSYSEYILSNDGERIIRGTSDQDHNMRYAVKEFS